MVCVEGIGEGEEKGGSKRGEISGGWGKGGRRRGECAKMGVEEGGEKCKCMYVSLKMSSQSYSDLHQ